MYLSWSICYYVPCIYSHARCLCVCVCACVCVCLCLCVRLCVSVCRILAEFQSRKAHRVHVRDKDLFKSLAVILVVVVGYMAAWTAVNVDHLETGTKLIKTAMTPDRLSYVLCKSLWWDYAIELGESLFCCGGE